MRAVIYARYSEGPRQTDQSIEGQVADCTAYAQQHGMDVIGLYADRHISGKSVEGRDEFQRMMKDADRHLFDVVIVWKVDRFGRNREDIAVNKIRLRHAGVQLHYAKEALPDGPEGILLEALLEGLAEYYSEDLRQKVTRGIRENAKKGKVAGGQIPIGYKKDAEGRVVVDPETAPLVQELFRRHIAGAPMEELRQLLVQAGIRGTRGAVPNRALVYRILRNRRYTGAWQIAGIDLPVEPIITEEVFEMAVDNYRTSRNNAAGRAADPYLLSGKCYCEVCGGKITGKSGTGKSGKKYKYYACKTKGCSTPQVAKEALEDQVVRVTAEDLLTPEMIEKLADAIMEIQAQEHSQGPVQDLEKRLASAERRRDNILQALEMSTSPSLAARLDALEAEAADLRLQLERARLARPVVPRELVRGWLDSFRAGDKNDPTVRRKLLQGFVGLVEIGPEYVTVYYNTTLKKEPCSHTAPKLEMTKPYANTPRVVGPWIVVSIPR
jgi:DNA invertase Pin-like site-specific DNA recombinase